MHVGTFVYNITHRTHHNDYDYINKLSQHESVVCFGELDVLSETSPWSEKWWTADQVKDFQKEQW